MNWLPVFHLQWLGHVPHVRQHLPTTIVWNSPMRELIGSVMVSSPLLLTFGTLSLLLYFRLPSTFLPSKGRSITTLGTRWHDFFSITLFRYFTIVLFFTLHFSFSQGMQTRERVHCARSVFPFIKKKKLLAEAGNSKLDGVMSPSTCRNILLSGWSKEWFYSISWHTANQHLRRPW